MAKQRRNIDILFNELKTQIIEQTEATSKAKIENLEKENLDLKNINTKLLKEAKKVDTSHENFKIMNILIERLKDKIQAANREEKADLIYHFLDCFFKEDFIENTYEVPIWLGCVVEYYSNRDTIIDILRLLDIEVPENIEKFRLPQDWTEEELDIVFDTMDKHYVCNGCIYEDNLRFWEPYVFDSVYDICYSQYHSEIPWQFLLRNPLLKKEKYLKQIGKMFCKPKNVYRSDSWLYFAKITDYLTLTDDEIKIILDNIDYTYYDGKDHDLELLLIKNIHLINNEVFLRVLYEYHKNSYSFQYTNAMLKMPYEFIIQYMKDRKDLEWLKKNKGNFTKEQIRELTLAALED